jgi:glutaredoxin-like YruB-family protein
MDVLIYTTPTCGYCRQAKEYLKARNVPFVEKNVAVDGIAAQEMVQRSGQRGVPVLVINGQTIVGFDRRRIDDALARPASPSLRLGAAINDASRYALQIAEGAYVGKVNAGSPAERAGMQVGDVIMSMAGQPIRTADDVQRIMAVMSAGQAVAVGVWRNGQRMQLKAQF